MQLISEVKLRELPYRVQYLRDFIEFTSEDAAALHAARNIISPLVPYVVDTVYEKLLSFSVTAKAFVPRQTGYMGLVPRGLNDLNKNHPQIKFRKDFLARWLIKLVTLDYDKPASWEYLDKVGIMHTGQVGFSHRESKPSLRVELIHCQMMLGFVEDLIVQAILKDTTELDEKTRITAMRAFSKVIWIQGDLFSRHYVSEERVAPGNIVVSRNHAYGMAAGLVGLGVFAHYVFMLSNRRW